MARRGRAGAPGEILRRCGQHEEDQAAHRRRPLPQPLARFVGLFLVLLPMWLLLLMMLLMLFLLLLLVLPPRLRILRTI